MCSNIHRELFLNDFNFPLICVFDENESKHTHKKKGTAKRHDSGEFYKRIERKKKLEQLQRYNHLQRRKIVLLIWTTHGQLSIFFFCFYFCCLPSSLFTALNFSFSLWFFFSLLLNRCFPRYFPLYPSLNSPDNEFLDERKSCLLQPPPTTTKKKEAAVAAHIENKVQCFSYLCNTEIAWFFFFRWTRLAVWLLQVFFLY